MNSWGRRGSVGIVLLIFLFGLYFYVRDDSGPVPEPPTLVEAPAPELGKDRVPESQNHRAPLPAFPSAGPPSAEECAEDREALQRATATSPEVCMESLREGACFPPLEHPSPVMSALALHQSMVEMFSDCPGVTPEDWLTDCSEYPCVLLLRREALQQDCPGSRQFAEVALDPDETSAQFGAVWERWAAFGEEATPAPVNSASSHALARYESRVELLGRTLQAHELALEAGEPTQRTQFSALSCDEVRATLQQLEGDEPCAALSYAWGCTEPRPRPIDPELALVHEANAEVWVDELEETCMALATSADAVLDCSSLPCLLAFTLPPEVSSPGLGCRPTAEMFTYRQAPSLNRPAVTVTPVWDEQTQQDPEVQRRWEIEQEMRAHRLVQELSGGG